LVITPKSIPYVEQAVYLAIKQIEKQLLAGGFEIEKE